MITEAQVEELVTGGRKAMEAAIAALPFRDTPSFEDVYAAGEALVRHLLTAQPLQSELPPVANDTEPPPEAA